MKLKKNDLFVGIYLLTAIISLFISVPSGLLNVFLAINMAIAMIVLFTSLYSKDVLDMQSFPTILLFTTIFRISLNV